MKPSRTIWVFFVHVGMLGGGWLGAAPPEPIQPGQKVFTLCPVPLLIQSETQAVVGPAVELVAEHVQEEWVWVTVRGWVRSSLVLLPPGGLLQSGLRLTIRSEAPLQVELETRAVIPPGRKVIFEQAQGDWLWVAVQGWCQSQYLTKESPTHWQTPPQVEHRWQYPQEPTRYYYYYYHYDSSPYWYWSYPYRYYYDRSYLYRYYYDRYGPGYYRYGLRPWIDIDIDIYRYWPPDRYRLPDRDRRPPDRDHRPPEWDRRPWDRDRWPDRPPYRPDGPHRMDRPGYRADRPGLPSDKPDRPDHRPDRPDLRPDRPAYPDRPDPRPDQPGRPNIRPDSRHGPWLLPPSKPDISPKPPWKPEPTPKLPGSKLESRPKTPPIKSEITPKLPDITPKLPGKLEPAPKTPSKPMPGPKILSKSEWDISAPKMPGKLTPDLKTLSKTE